MFGNWTGSGLGDCNSDGIVDAADAGIMFAEWTGDALVAVELRQLPEPALAGWYGLAGWLGASILRRREFDCSRGG